MIRSLIAFAALAFAAPALAKTETGPMVDAPAGAAAGKMDGAIRVFKGLPYAQAPVGPLRWQPPQPLARWTGTRNAASFGPACVQPQGNLSSIYSGPPLPLSEDCLTLNVWTPANAKKAPVLVWIHGGALWTGSSREGTYDGRKMAERGVMVVSINYRLGVLGYLAHPELSAESPQGISGNYGLLDQVAALQWVQKNVAAFGGDPANVTIAGESAGALSVMYLMVTPQAKGLFAKAISESGYMVSMPELSTVNHAMPSAEQGGVALGKALGGRDLKSLRGMDASVLTLAASQAGFAPFANIDGKTLPEQMVVAFSAGHQAAVPILAGFNQGEIRSLMILAPPVPASAVAYEATIRERYADLADAFLKLYPSSNMKESILETTRDGLYGWTAERLVRKQTKIGQPSYLYEWDHGYPAMDNAGYHAFHASELPYVFGTAKALPPLWPKPPATASENALSDAMLDYWTSFAKTGTPKAAGAANWPAFGRDAGYLHITDVPHAETHPLPGMYALTEEVVCRRIVAGNQPWHWNFGIVSPPMPPKGKC